MGFWNKLGVVELLLTGISVYYPNFILLFRQVQQNSRGAKFRDKFQTMTMQIYYFVSGNKLSPNNL